MEIEIIKTEYIFNETTGGYTPFKTEIPLTKCEDIIAEDEQFNTLTDGDIITRMNGLQNFLCPDTLPDNFVHGVKVVDETYGTTSFVIKRCVFDE